MKASDIPTKFSIPFANAAGGSYIRNIPTASQIGIQDGAASLTDGFPPLNFQPVGAGGVPPFGQDFNGLLYRSTAWNRWQGAGALVAYDPVFSTAIGGYPRGALIIAAVATNLWLSIIDDNTTDPDGDFGVGWVPIFPTLSTNTTYYVNNVTGSNSNNGLTAGTAWATLTFALAALQAVNLNGYTATIQLATTGTDYDAPGAFIAPGSGTLVIQGDTANQSNVVISGTGPGGGNSGMLAPSFGVVTLKYLTIKNTGTINSSLLSYTQTFIQNVSFTSTTTSAPALVGAAGGSVFIQAGCIFGGSAQCMWRASGGGVITMNANCVMANSPTYSLATVQAEVLGVVQLTNNTWTWTGSPVTGKRYDASLNSVISSAGLGVNFFPGTIAGTTSTGGQYV